MAARNVTISTHGVYAPVHQLPGARLPAVLTSERGAQEWRHALHNKASTAAGAGSQQLTAVLRGHGYAQRLRMQA